MDAQKGIIGVLGLLLASSLAYQITSSSDNTFICTTTQEIGVFDHLSKSAITAYWTEQGTEKSRQCRGGTWIKFVGVSPVAVSYRCDYLNCTPIS